MNRNIPAPSFLYKFFVAAIILFVCAAHRASLAQESPAEPSRFVHAKDGQLFLDEKPFALRGVNFSNRYNEAIEPGELLASKHHSRGDFFNISSIGMNAVRFAFNGEWYEKDKASFFNWIDQNIQWAQEAGIYLILDLHVPIGGFWLDPTSDKVDFRIWSEPAVQARNIQMWIDIAAHYRNEPRIAAYDVLNEAVTSDSDGSQWKHLAQKLVQGIRSIDKNHLIIIGKLYGTEQSYTVEGIESQFLVNDGNVMYDFHFYAPLNFTHQYASWLPRPMTDGGSYPDEDVLIPTGQQRFITSLTQEIPHEFPLSREWAKFELNPITINNPEIRMGIPVLQVKGNLSGTVLFDDLEVIEYNAEGKSRTLVKEPLSQLTVWDWWHWNAPSADRNGTFERIVKDGANDSYSLSISDISGVDGYSGWSSDLQWFPVRQGHSYTMTGQIKSTVPDAYAYFDIAFYGDAADNTEKAFLRRNREYLEWEFQKHYQFGVDNNVPISVMEFGLTHEGFDKGGEKWVEDVLDLFLKHGVSFAYWDYHSDRMGMYYKESDKPPGNPNKQLIQIFQRKLLNSDRDNDMQTTKNP